MLTPCASAGRAGHKLSPWTRTTPARVPALRQKSTNFLESCRNDAPHKPLASKECRQHDLSSKVTPKTHDRGAGPNKGDGDGERFNRVRPAKRRTRDGGGHVRPLMGAGIHRGKFQSGKTDAGQLPAREPEADGGSRGSAVCPPRA